MVPRTRNIPVVMCIDESGIVGILVVMVIVDVHPTNACHPSKVVVSDKNISGLDYSSVIIVVNRHIFHLYHRTIIVILDIGVIVISRIETDVHVGNSHVNTESARIVKEVELAVGINCKFNILFNKNEWFPISIGATENVFGFRRSYSRVSNHQEGNQ